MRYLKFGLIVFALCIMTDCEKEATPSIVTDFKGDAKILGFVAEKCYCCWGWVIQIGSDTIKADSIPGLSPSENLNFPIDVNISVGNLTHDCSGLSMPAYYEIELCTLIK